MVVLVPPVVEMAVSELKRAWRPHRRAGNSRRIDTTKAKIILLDAAPAVLGASGQAFGSRSRSCYRRSASTSELNAKAVVGADNTGVDIVDSGTASERGIPCRCKVGQPVSASRSASSRPEQSGGEVDRAGGCR